MKTITDERLAELIEWAREDRGIDPGKTFTAMNSEETCEIFTELQELREVCSSIPHTADGVPVHTAMTVYLPTLYYGKVLTLRVEKFDIVAFDPSREFLGSYRIEKCYSTIEAAEAAQSALAYPDSR